MNDIINVENTEIVESIPVSADLLIRFTAYIDGSKKTVETYTRALRQLFKYLSDNGISRPTREDIIAYRDSLAVDHKPTTVQNYITAARLFFQWTEQEHLYPDIAQHIKGAKLDREHKKDYLTSKQVRTIITGIDRTTAAGSRDYAIFILMTECGLRTIEVSRANIEDLRTLGDETVLYIQGKGRTERTEYVKIHEHVEQAIRKYLQIRGSAAGNDPLFVSTSNNSTGSRLSTRTISGIIKECMRAAGYDSSRLTAHSLRHTAVTLSLLAGKDITEVQQFARHASVNTTMIYAHALDKAKNSCSAAVEDAIFQ
jgi:integrase/recombinase XerC